MDLSVDELVLGHGDRRGRQPAEAQEPIDEAGLLLDLKRESMSVTEGEGASWNGVTDSVDHVEMPEERRRVRRC